MFKFPKISCLIVTNGRLSLIKKSIYCYIQQTYSNKELVVIAQGKSDQNAQLEEYLESLNRQDIQFVKAPSTLSLGAMRNLSIEVSTGEIVCQWDDDDLSHPHRLMDQYHTLLGKDVVASAYTQYLKYFTNTGRLYCVNLSEERDWRKFLPGTIMFYKKFFHTFHNVLYPEKGLEVGEDLNVLLKFFKFGKIAEVPKYHYIYIFHEKNTCNEEHHKEVLNKKLLGEEEILLLKDSLIKTLQVVNIDRPLKISVVDKTVFDFIPGK